MNDDKTTPDTVIELTYAATGKSTETDALGMREMQRRAYACRREQYLLLKSPPASGKSRALMFLALHKLLRQDRRKVIVAVPERSIGSSFADTDLKEHGFIADWRVKPYYNLCTPGDAVAKVPRFKEFMANNNASILLCTHATLRYAFEQIETSAFNGCLLGIDEFHHVSADEETSKLGTLVHAILTQTDAHVIAMTGSYFRGDSVPILLPEDEARFKHVVYTYYDQLNGYTYLKSLGIDYRFYQGSYLDALPEVLDTDKKTILHIPNVNSSESTGDKQVEVGKILESIGDVESEDPLTKVLTVRRRGDGKLLRVADLVDDNPKHRDPLMDHLRFPGSLDKIDLIIALGMAKEGFDWPACEHALTVGYRGSLTEVVQIIGRATRDYPGKVRTQFTNLLAEPLATRDETVVAVNSMLKAIAASLLMEQVLAPDFKFMTRASGGEEEKPGTIRIDGIKQPSTERTKEIIEQRMTEIKAKFMQNPEVQKHIASPNSNPEYIAKILLPRTIEESYPDLNPEEVEEVREHVAADLVLKAAKIVKEPDGAGGSRQFVVLGERFVNIEDLDVNLIDSVNPFRGAFDVISKRLSAPMMRALLDELSLMKTTLTLDEAMKMWPSVSAFMDEYGRAPRAEASERREALLGQAWLVIRHASGEMEEEQGDGADRSTEG